VRGKKSEGTYNGREKSMSYTKKNKKKKKLGLKIERKSLFKLHNINERERAEEEEYKGGTTQLGLMERGGGGAHCTQRKVF